MSNEYSGASVAIVNVSVPEGPLSFIGRCAGESTLKSGKGDAKRAVSCIRMGHTSVAEHVSVSFRISDVSRSLTHQLVRHRLMSVVQQSQRYVRMDLSGDDWYVTPPYIAKDESLSSLFRDAMGSAASAYETLLEAGMRAEDARYVLPEATKTSVTVTMNMRELSSFWVLRTDHHAQWEIRGLAHEMRKALVDATAGDDEWQGLIRLMLPLG